MVLGKTVFLPESFVFFAVGPDTLCPVHVLCLGAFLFDDTCGGGLGTLNSVGTAQSINRFLSVI